MEQSSTAHPLGALPIPHLLAKYAIPSIVSMLVMSLYNIVDQIFIGRGVGYLGNAATTVAFPLTTVMLSLCLLIGNGAAAYVSLELGRGNQDGAKQILGNAFVLLLGISAVLMTAGILFLRPLLLALGATAEVYPFAREYTSIILFGAPFAMLSSGLANVIRADGSPRYSMFFSLTGAVLNVILDPILIFRFDMGVQGAAYATVFSQMVSALLALYYLLRRANYIRLTAAGMRLRLHLTARIASLGSSSFVTQMSITIINVVLNNSITYYGGFSPYGSDIPLAAMGVVMKINAILTSFVLGVAIGAQPILGYNYGARLFSRVKRTLQIEIAVALTFSTAVCILFVTVPQVFIGLFGDSNAVFNEFAARYLRTYLCCVFIIGLQIPTASYFQAVGKPLKSMLLSMSRHLLLLAPLVLALPLLFGLDGILYAGPCADLLAAGISGGFLIRELRFLTRSEESSGA